MFQVLSGKHPSSPASLWWILNCVQKITCEPGKQVTCPVSAKDHTGTHILNPHSLPSPQLQVDGGSTWWGAVRLIKGGIFECKSFIINQKVEPTVVVIPTFGYSDPEKQKPTEKFSMDNSVIQFVSKFMLAKSTKLNNCIGNLAGFFSKLTDSSH